MTAANPSSWTTPTATCSLKPSVKPAPKPAGHVHAWCLMPNHFHLVLATSPQANLVACYEMAPGHLLPGVSTAATNSSATCFSGRYKALIVDGSGNATSKPFADARPRQTPPAPKSLRPPQSALLLTPGAASRHAICKKPAKRPACCCCVEMLTRRARYSPGQLPPVAREFARRLQWRQRSDDNTDDFKPLRRGWCLGDKNLSQRAAGAN